MSKRVVVSIQDHNPATDTEKLFAPRKHSIIILVCFDTEVIQAINARNKSDELEPLYAPAKYALSYDEGWSDSSIFGQVMLHTEEYRQRAIWFKHIAALPHALEKLQAKFPELMLPDQIEYMIDWPFRERDLELSFVTPNPPHRKS